jgi:hypothetical protein
MSPNELGRATEARFLLDALERGLLVSTPFADLPGYDAVVDRDGGLYRVQIKGSRLSLRDRRWTSSVSRGAGGCSNWDILGVYLTEHAEWRFFTRGQVPMGMMCLQIFQGSKWMKASRGWDIFDLPNKSHSTVPQTNHSI